MALNKNQLRDINFFGELHVLNLLIRPDRKCEMANQFRSIAVEEEQVHWFGAVKPDEPAGFLSAAYRGNFESHLAVLDLAVERGLDRLLIMEDDLNFESYFSTAIAKVTAQLSAVHWDMFYGGAVVKKTLPYSDCLQEISFDEGVLLDHFIAFNGNTIRLARDYLRAQLGRQTGDPKGGPMAVDGSYSWMRRDHRLRTFIAVPQLGYQRQTRSDLSPKWFDRIPLFRGLVESVRRSI